MTSPKRWATSILLTCCALLVLTNCSSDAPPDQDLPETPEAACQAWRRAGCKKEIECLDPHAATDLATLDSRVEEKFALSESCVEEVAASPCPTYAIKGYMECISSLGTVGCDSICFGRPDYSGCSVRVCTYECM